jgi:O-antigen ligase
MIFGSIAIVLALYLGHTTIGLEFWIATKRLILPHYVVNSITLGHIGVSVLIAAYCRLSYDPGRIERVFLIVLGLSAFWLLFVSASKGPILALLIVYSIVFFLSDNKKLLLMPIVFAIPLAFFYSNSVLIERMSNLSKSISVTARIEYMESALGQIMEAPFLGTSFLISDIGVYPHNVILEAAMAIGIPAACLLVYLIAVALSRIRFYKLKAEPFFYLIYVQYLVGGLVSSAIYGSTALWVSLALLLSDHRSDFDYESSRDSLRTSSN